MAKPSPLSPQRRYQLDHAARSLCLYCSSPVVGDSSTCAKHNRARKLRQRKQAQCKPWHQGGPGRPPVSR